MTPEKLEALLQEPRWPHETPDSPLRWNRVGGLVDMCEEIFGRKITDPDPEGVLPLICEIGVASGVSTEVFAEFGKVHAIDFNLWKPAVDRFQGREDRVTLLQAESWASSELVEDGTYFAVYLDSDHEYRHVHREIELWKSKVAPGGYLCGHDHTNSFPGVQQAVRELLQGPDRVFSDGSWYCRV